MTPAQRDYERFVTRKIPRGASGLAETAIGREAEKELCRLKKIAVDILNEWRKQ